MICRENPQEIQGGNPRTNIAAIVKDRIILGFSYFKMPMWPVCQKNAGINILYNATFYGKERKQYLAYVI
jgi:hypothetical protein